jgi:hypothetical protein
MARPHVATQHTRIQHSYARIARANFRIVTQPFLLTLSTSLRAAGWAQRTQGNVYVVKFDFAGQIIGCRGLGLGHTRPFNLLR